jgi:transcription elongation factor Elf1
MVKKEKKQMEPIISEEEVLSVECPYCGHKTTFLKANTEWYTRNNMSIQSCKNCHGSFVAVADISIHSRKIEGY